VQRISVVGNSGSGKTTMARALADRLGLTHVELDAVFHQPGWTELPADVFRAQVAQRLDASGGRWVTCGNYRVVNETVWQRADTIVWLDLPRRTVMRRVMTRTARRVVTREELWNGNREPWSNLWAWAPERNIMRWAWTQHDKYHERYGAAMADPRWREVEFVRLRSTAEAERWLASLPRGGVSP
jgi:adenylate kinase family enzyme